MLSHVWYFLSTVMFSRLYCASNSYYSYLSATCFRFLVAPRGSGKNRAIKASASRRPDLKGAIFGRVGGRACARGGETERRRLNDRNERSKHILNGHFYSTVVDSSFEDHASERTNQATRCFTLTRSPLRPSIDRISSRIFLLANVVIQY